MYTKTDAYYWYGYSYQYSTEGRGNANIAFDSIPRRVLPGRSALTCRRSRRRRRRRRRRPRQRHLARRPRGSSPPYARLLDFIDVVDQHCSPLIWSHGQGG